MHESFRYVPAEPQVVNYGAISLALVFPTEIAFYFLSRFPERVLLRTP